MWSAGASNSGEENINLYGTPLEEDGGYNLFRVGKGVNTKPEHDGEELKTYVIKRECLIPSEGKKPAHPDLNVPREQNNSVSNSIKYQDEYYFGKKPKIGIISNIEEIDDDSLIDMPDAPPPQHVMPQEMMDLRRDFEEPMRKQIRGKKKRKLSLKQLKAKLSRTKKSCTKQINELKKQIKKKDQIYFL